MKVVEDHLHELGGIHSIVRMVTTRGDIDTHSLRGELAFLFSARPGPRPVRRVSLIQAATLIPSLASSAGFPI
jgi:hypothetical protein